MEEGWRVWEKGVGGVVHGGCGRRVWVESVGGGCWWRTWVKGSGEEDKDDHIWTYNLAVYHGNNQIDQLINKKISVEVYHARAAMAIFRAKLPFSGPNIANFIVTLKMII